MERYKNCWIRHDEKGFTIFDAGYPINSTTYKHKGNAKRAIDRYLAE